MIKDGMIERLATRLSEPLPGLDAWSRMMPMARIEDVRRLGVPANARQSAVLILLVPGVEGHFVPLIQRGEDGGVHSRQVGLPGGRVEPHDPDRVATALRETQEEIGVEPETIRVLGQLSEIYIPPSNYVVQPVLGVVAERPLFVPNPSEVSGIIEAPVHHFVDHVYRGEREVVAGGMRRRVPAFDILGHVVWGATAMMMSELGLILEELGEYRSRP